MKTRLAVLALTCSLGMVGCGTYNHDSKHSHAAAQNDTSVAKSHEVSNTNIARASSSRTISNNKVLFGFDKTTLSNDAKKDLDDIAAILQESPDSRVTVEGYTDVRGKAAYNLGLGMRRAQSVAQYLQEKGAQPSQVEVRSFGAERVAVAGDSTDVHAANRRAEIVFENDTTWG